MTLSQFLKTTRQYFWNLDFTEVEIPYLNPSLPLEPNIYSFNTLWTHSQAKYYLPTSPEMALKNHLSASQNNCFSISHCFRDLEAEGPHHAKEFLMLEWYEINKNYQDLMASVENYVSQFLKVKYTVFKLPSHLPDNEPDFNQYFLNEIEPELPKNKAVFITGYPAFLSPLAQPSESNVFSAHSEREGMSPKVASTAKNNLTSKIADRFELYINGIEIANGCTENRDPFSIKKTFEHEKSYRLKNNLPLHPYSQNFINDCAKLPPCAGVGLGIDRLLSLING